MSAYVCRVHPTRPVRPSGTGCTECEIERRNRPRRHGTPGRVKNELPEWAQASPNREDTTR